MAGVEKSGTADAEPRSDSNTTSSFSVVKTNSVFTVSNIHTRKEVEKRLIRKLDIFLVPVLCLMSVFNYMDKALLGIANLNSLSSDLELTPMQFNLALSIFHISYLLCQVPSNLLITRVRPAIYLQCVCGLWSAVAACHAVVNTPSQLFVLRFLLGMADAPFWVGAMHVLSAWYTRNELAKRTSVLLGTMVLFITFMYPMAAGVMACLEGKNNWAGWRWLYLVFGCTGIIVALLGFISLPNYPEQGARRFWLNQSEQQLARQRIAENGVNKKNVDKNKLRTGLIDALRDKRTWIFVLMFMSRKSLDALYAYLPKMIATMVPQLTSKVSQEMSTQTLALLLGSPPAILAAIMSFALAYTSDRFSERTFHTVGPLLIGLIGLLTSVSTLDSVARYVAIYLWLGGSISSSSLAWSWVANTIQETPEKRAVGIAVVNVLGGLGGVWSPFLFRGKDEETGYVLAFAVLSGFVVLDVGCCLVMRSILKKQNRGLNEQGTNVYVL